jgi:hypothetical protein
MEEKLVSKSYRPKLFLSGAVWGRAASVDHSNSYRSLGEGFGVERGNYLVGVGINYNIFDLQRKKAKLHTQQLMVDQAGQKLQEEQANITMNIAQSAAEVATAEQRLDEIPHQTKAKLMQPIGKSSRFIKMGLQILLKSMSHKICSIRLSGIISLPSIIITSHCSIRSLPRIM